MSSSGVIGISNELGLQALANVVNGTNGAANTCSGKTIVLTDNVNLRGIDNWTPIGNNSYRFKGTFNGNGYHISDMSVSGSTCVGLFGYVENSEINNLSIINTAVSGTGNWVGGLVGYARNSTITNCYVTGTVSGNAVGGLVGYVSGPSTIIDSYANGSVSGGSNVGGLVGVVGGNSIISGSYATGSVLGTGNFVGGLVGYASSTTISGSHACNFVVGPTSVGGFIGYTNNVNMLDLSSNTYIDNTHNGLAIGAETTNPSGVQYDANYTPPSGGSSSAITLQIGLDGSSDSRLTLNLGLDLSILSSIVSDPAGSSNLTTIDNLLSSITSLETNIGAGLNRLESVQDSLVTQQKTLTAARSIVQDADVSQESARYIRSQILQQASASLLTVANQSPSLLLSLINGMR